MPTYYYPQKTPYTALAPGTPEGVIGFLQENTRKENFGTVMVGEWVEKVPFLGKVEGNTFRIQPKTRFFTIGGGVFDSQAEGTVEPGPSDNQAQLRFEFGRLTWRGRLSLWATSFLLLVFLVSTLSFSGAGFALPFLLVVILLQYGFFLLFYNLSRRKMLELMTDKLLLTELQIVEKPSEERKRLADA